MSWQARFKNKFEGKTPDSSTKKGGPKIGAALLIVRCNLFLEHLDAINVDLVTVDFSRHGNVMSVVVLEGIGIVHCQYFLISVADDDRTGARFDALFSAFGPVRTGMFGPAFRVADPALHSLRVAGKRH